MTVQKPSGPELRDQGLARVDGATSPAWRGAADRAILRLAATRQDFTAEDVMGLVPRPGHPNAVGARFHAAAARGWITTVGLTRADRAPRHASGLRVWRGTDYGAHLWNAYGQPDLPMPQPVPRGQRCWRCQGQGFVRAPCTVCGAFRTSSGEVAYQVGSIFGDDAPPVFRKPRKKPRADRP